MFIKPNGEVQKDTKMYSEKIGILAIVELFFGIMVILLGLITVPEGSVLFFVGILLSIMAYLLFAKCYSIYEFCVDGIWIKCPFFKEKLIYWDDFQQVCIYPTYLKSGTYIEIVFVKHGEKPRKYNPWKTQNLFKIGNIITIDYSEDTLKRIKKYYCKKIVDYRKSLVYLKD